GVVVLGYDREIAQSELADEGRVSSRVPPRQVRESRVVVRDDAGRDRARRVGREGEGARLVVRARYEAGEIEDGEVIPGLEHRVRLQQDAIGVAEVVPFGCDRDVDR